MSEKFIEKTIQIHAPASKVWQVFTDPELTRELGGEYASDWKVGSPFGWKNLEGETLTHGEILKIKPNALLQHNIFDVDKTTITSIITYELKEEKQSTRLRVREDFLTHVSSEEVYKAVEAGWNMALLAVKALAEKE